ncbi:MAG: aldehyde dehydrogenase, partial [Actinobacteria bacterium]|nr:aldehyde dehydrogenase [Actinomycetota bacterium]NDG77253.1 aldehyde dehydrogenase [Acidimicrobiia bacterium]
MLHIKPGTAWADFYARAMAAAPEAFDTQSIRNLIGGEWVAGSAVKPHIVPVDDTQIPGAPMISSDEAKKAMSLAVKHDREWSLVPLDERMRRVSKAVELLREHRDTIAGLLMWEIGKP